MSQCEDCGQMTGEGHIHTCSPQLPTRPMTKDMLAHHFKQIERRDEDRNLLLREDGYTNKKGGVMSEFKVPDYDRRKINNALLWMYRRMKYSYGRLPFIEEAIALTANAQPPQSAATLTDEEILHIANEQ